jgi:hypothetical protein
VAGVGIADGVEVPADLVLGAVEQAQGDRTLGHGQDQDVEPVAERHAALAVDRAQPRLLLGMALLAPAEQVGAEIARQPLAAPLVAPDLGHDDRAQVRGRRVPADGPQPVGARIGAVGPQGDRPSLPRRPGRAVGRRRPRTAVGEAPVGHDRAEAEALPGDRVAPADQMVVAEGEPEEAAAEAGAMAGADAQLHDDPARPPDPPPEREQPGLPEQAEGTRQHLAGVVDQDRRRPGSTVPGRGEPGAAAREDRVVRAEVQRLEEAPRAAPDQDAQVAMLAQHVQHPPPQDDVADIVALPGAVHVDRPSRGRAGAGIAAARRIGIRLRPPATGAGGREVGDLLAQSLQFSILSNRRLGTISRSRQRPHAPFSTGRPSCRPAPDARDMPLDTTRCAS